MDGTRGYYAKQSKSIRERQLSNDLTWNLRNKTEDHREREEKIKQDEIGEGDRPQETLIHRKQEGRWRGGVGEGGNWVIKEGM